MRRLPPSSRRESWVALLRLTLQLPAGPRSRHPRRMTRLRIGMSTSTPRRPIPCGAVAGVWPTGRLVVYSMGRTLAPLSSACIRHAQSSFVSCLVWPRPISWDYRKRRWPDMADIGHSLSDRGRDLGHRPTRGSASVQTDGSLSDVPNQWDSRGASRLSCAGGGPSRHRATRTTRARRTWPGRHGCTAERAASRRRGGVQARRPARPGRAAARRRRS
jgi:hypothetical protein